MPATSDTRTITSDLAATLEKAFKRGAVADAVYKFRPLLNKLRESGNLITVSGGERLRCQFTYQESTTAMSYSDDEPLDVTRQDNQTSAFFNWKQYSDSIVITGKERAINKGQETRLFDLLEQRTSDATQGIQKKIVTDIFGDGTGNGSKAITGLEAMIETTPLSTAYAGVSTATTAWTNQVQTAVGATSVNLLTKLRTISNDAMEVGGNGPAMGNILHVTTQAVHEVFRALHVPAMRYGPGETPDFGIDGIPFEGGEVIWDPGITTSGLWYRLDLNHMGLFVHEDLNFSESEEGLQKPVNQHTLISQIFFMGNLVCDNRPKQGKLTGLT